MELVWFIQLLIMEGVSAAEAFLKPVLDRSNLNTITRCRVCKIIIKNKKAIGVEYILRGQKMNAFAAKEVIISAGAFQSLKF